MIEENNIEKQNSISIPAESVQSPAMAGPTPVSGSSTVVVADNNKLPAWFMALFIMIVIVFIAVNYLLMSALRQQKVETITSYNLPSPTPVISPAEESTSNLDRISDSDEITILESEIEVTSISSIKEGLELLDKKLEVTPW